jgi:hypothetical protein
MGETDEGLQATGHAKAACEHVQQYNRTTMWERDQVPADSADQLSEFAALAAALPQAFSQLASILEQARDNHELRMDEMTAESDPCMAIDVARLQLEEARGLAVDLQKMLNAAHNATVHIISDGLDDGQESTPWEKL